MFKIMKLVIRFDMLLSPSFKRTTSFANIVELELAQVNVYTRKDFESLGIGSLYKK